MPNSLRDSWARDDTYDATGREHGFFLRQGDGRTLHGLDYLGKDTEGAPSTYVSLGDGIRCAISRGSESLIPQMGYKAAS